MFEHWGEFYLMAGSAAAVLIGLIFVVVSLLQDRSRSSVLTGSQLYMGPIVLMVSFDLALSASALTPGMDRQNLAMIAGVIAVWGLVRAVMSLIGIGRLEGEHKAHWTDPWFYAIGPLALYLCLGLVAGGLWHGSEWAVLGLAGTVLAMLLLAIRNEWDLITWIAPRPGKGDPDLGT
jgi:hypothetical protein